MLATVLVKAFFSERTSNSESSEPGCKFLVYRLEKMKKDDRSSIPAIQESNGSILINIREMCQEF